ncbi:MAG: nucleotidyl transferase AbiEii/AbiGii toxin family protein [Desulfobia sp.]
MTEILSKEQNSILAALPDSLKENFVFSGGTALAAFYLFHRLSEDLDFVALTEDQPVIFGEIGGILKRFQDVELQTKLYDRCIYYLPAGKKEAVKVEFVPLYFPRIKPVEKESGLYLESLEDLAAGKIMAMADRFEEKDFVDVFSISRETGWDFRDMIKLAGKRNPMPYEYVVNPQRILNHPDGLTELHFVKPVDAREIIEFFRKADQDLRDSLSTDFF